MTKTVEFIYLTSYTKPWQERSHRVYEYRVRVDYNSKLPFGMWLTWDPGGVASRGNTAVPIYMNEPIVRFAAVVQLLLDCCLYCAGSQLKFGSTGWNRPDCGQDGTQTHTHACKHRGTVAVTKGLEARLLLYRGCVKAYQQLRVGVVLFTCRQIRLLQCTAAERTTKKMTI